MSDLDDMRRLLNHLKVRWKLGNQTKQETFAKYVVALVAERPLHDLLKLPKTLQAFVGSIANHRIPVIHGMVELAYKANGWGKSNSAFDKWFQEQFGPPVFNDPIALEEYRDELNGLQAKVDEMKRRLVRHGQYEEHQRAALYAWQAKGTTPKTLAKARPRARRS